MRLARELGDAWGALLAAFSGGMTWAISGDVGAGIGVAAAVYGVKVVTGLLAARSNDDAEESGRVLPVLEGSEESHWLYRARLAERAFDDVTSSVRGGPVSERVRGFGVHSDDALAALRRIAGQASAVSGAMRRINAERLGTERQRLQAALTQRQDAEVRAERERALASVEAQLEAYARLGAARRTLLARLESGTLALEGLVARLAEVVALTETTFGAGDSAAQVDSLAAELDGLRAGLVEAEDASARALGNVPGLTTPPAGTVSDASDRRRRRPQTFPPR